MHAPHDLLLTLQDGSTAAPRPSLGSSMVKHKSRYVAGLTGPVHGDLTLPLYLTSVAQELGCSLCTAEPWPIAPGSRGCSAVQGC